MGNRRLARSIVIGQFSVYPILKALEDISGEEA